jgi:hypothetical protein
MATIPHPGDSLCKAREVRKQCVCGHTWIGTIQDENCPRCNPNDADEGSSLPPKYDTPEPRPAWLDSPLAPTDQQMKDYRESFLLPPLDITQEEEATGRVICNDCGGYLMFKCEGNTIRVFHDCYTGKHSRESFRKAKRIRC